MIQDRQVQGQPRASKAERNRHQAMLPSRILDILLLVATVGAVAALNVGGDLDKDVGPKTLAFVTASMAWITLGMAYAAIRIHRIRRARKGDQRWPGWLAGRRANYLMTLGTGIIVITAAVNVAVRPGNDPNSTLVRGFGMAMVLVAWTILQLAYTERYARLYLEDRSGVPALDFPATPNPSLLEFGYFAFTVGTTFGTSDTTVQSSRMRGVVLCHGVLAFVYNTAVLGMVVGLIAG
jgi:uncharacterized membrane protein